MPETKQRRTEYRINLSSDDNVRVSFDRAGPRVLRFSVQYVARIAGEWQPIVRFDTAHGHAHLYISLPGGGQETRELPFSSYNTALTFAIRDVQEKWPFYRERFERWRHESRRNVSEK
jgi:hypothetical protein